MAATGKRNRHQPYGYDPQSGSTITVFAIAIVSLFFLLGLSIDLGSAYVLSERLSKSVDAGALAGARDSSQGDAAVRRAAIQVASANYNGERPANFSVQITNAGADTKRVTVSADTAIPTRFAVFMGRTSLKISTGAEATRYPLDLSLVLDRSASLDRNNVFGDMQDAAKGFLNFFDETVDQIGVTSYSTAGVEHVPVQKYFQAPGAAAISAMTPLSDTNIHEGLCFAKTQMDAAFDREGATRAVVLFTDGRPTAFRDQLTFGDSACPSYNGIIATYISGQSYRGLFRTADARKVTNFRPGCAVDTAINASGAPSPVPTAMFNGSMISGDTIRAGAIAKSEQVANNIRSAGYTIYTIGLGNPNSSSPADNPDLDFLRRLANEHGTSDQSQPRGEMFFAPSADELDRVFAELANRLLTRITR